MSGSASIGARWVGRAARARSLTAGARNGSAAGGPADLEDACQWKNLKGLEMQALNFKELRTVATRLTARRDEGRGIRRVEAGGVGDAGVVSLKYAYAMWRRHGIDSKAGQTRNAWRPCGFVLTPLAAPCRSIQGTRPFSSTAALPAPRRAAGAQAPARPPC